MDFGRREVPSTPYVCYLVKKVKETDILIDKPKREKLKTVRIPENIAAVAESVCEAPSIPIHRRSQQLNISEASLRRILNKDLGMMPYKVQLVPSAERIWLCISLNKAGKWACDRLTEDAYFGKKNHLFKQNCRIWGTENPHAYIKNPTHSKQGTV